MFYGYDCYAVLVLKIKSIKLLLSIIFKRFAVFFGLIKRGLKYSKESLQHVGGFYIGSNTLIQHFARLRESSHVSNLC